MNQLIKSDQNKKHFEVVENSNYKVTDSYQNEYIISFDHFQKLSQALFFGEGDFTTINNTVVNKRYIFKIEPTKEKTEKQKKEEELLKKNLKAEEDYRLSLFALKKNFDIKYYDEIYGQGNWKLFPTPLFGKNNNEKIISTTDRLNCSKAFAKNHPQESQEIEFMMNRNEN